MASENISFEQLPSSIRKPGKYIEFNTKLAVRTLPPNPQRLLIIAQMAEGKTAPLEPVQLFDDISGAELFGYGSQAHRMLKAAITANLYLDVSVLPVPPSAAGIAAVGSLALEGTAQALGVVALTIGTTRMAVAVDALDTARTIAENLLDAINDEVALPVLASLADAETSTLTITAKDKGSNGNYIALAADSTAKGISFTVNAMGAVTQGQEDADLTDAYTAVFSGDYQVFCIPYFTEIALATLRNHLDAVGHALEQRGAVGAAFYPGSFAEATTTANNTNAGRISMPFLPGFKDAPEEIAAAYAAVIAYEEDPARPLNTLVLTGIAAPDVEYRLGRNEQEVLLKNGVTPLEVQPGEEVGIVRAISTYTKNAEGINDIALLDITTIRTLDYTRKAVRERISLRFPREKLSARTAPKVRSEILDVLRNLETLEILEEVEANKEGVICERDLQDPNRLNAKIPADVVNGLHVFAGRIDLLL